MTVDYELLKEKYCKHACVAMEICTNHRLSMTLSKKEFDLKRSEIFTVDKPTRRSSEKINVVYPALNLKGNFFAIFKIVAIYFIVGHI